MAPTWIHPSYEEKFTSAELHEESIYNLLKEGIEEFESPKRMEAYLRSKLTEELLEQPFFDMFLGNFTSELDRQIAEVQGEILVPENLELFWIAPDDAGGGFDLRAFPEWTGDREDWEWAAWADEDIGRGCIDIVESMHDLIMDNDAISESTVWGATMLAALSYMGVFTRAVIDRGVIKFQRPTQIALGMPDAMYGVFLGECRP